MLGIHKNVAAKENAGMKRLFFSIVILVAASVSVFAQDAQQATAKKEGYVG